MISLNNYFSNKLSSIEQAKIVKTICKMEKINRSLWKEKEKINNKSKIKYEPINRLNKVLNLLGTNSKLIIENDFINQNTNKDWMLDYFSSTTYYKFRKIATEEFLYYYFNQFKF
ncbi:MG284/MPN403 family protein [Mycoplasmopsis gallinarum]|uniref:MG284/MPN403 family protein n=1 Tax=Mycoplasmopsis gallinarum TaxID=29557 RepID=UPI0007C52355|nr:hypothetical protein [Mycoplasmopsis gallinarum]